MPSIRYTPTPEPRNKHELRGEHPRRILQVVTGVNRYLDRPGHRTGLWLGELSHSWDVFMNAGFEQVIASPSGGAVPLELLKEDSELELLPVLWLPSVTVKLGPSGWVISIGLTSSRNCVKAGRLFASNMNCSE